MEDGSTEFSFSRFLTPWLSDYEGISVFMDCDMLVRCDIAELLDFVGGHDVYCVKHKYQPITKTKFLHQVQSVYPRKNWSSLMIFNNARCTKLTPEVVNDESGAYLHQMQWADSVGEIPVAYNHLVGEYAPNPNAKIVHFTLGAPCFEGYEDQEHSSEWHRERELKH
jgi:hypothetical protein